MERLGLESRADWQAAGRAPLYTGLVKAVGPDVFRLDADHDGWLRTRLTRVAGASRRRVCHALAATSRRVSSEHSHAAGRARERSGFSSACPTRSRTSASSR